jgi:MoaA/NifB/PqqE/SkfB family radical SAM enzyme
MSDTFCPVPWTTIATKTNGDLRVCCHASQGPNNALFLKEDGSVYNLSRDRMQDVRNHPLAKEMRRSLLNGERHPECKRCWSEESAGKRSKRHEMIEKMGDMDDFAIHTQSDGSVNDDYMPVQFDLRFGNLCNLKCRICGPSDSSMWYDDHFKMNGDVFYDQGRAVRLTRSKSRLTDNGTFNWYENPQFWTDLDDNMPQMTHVDLIGGEPMLIKAHFDFLERCVEQGHAEHINLEYATNITNIHTKALNIWKNFKSVYFGCSIDGYGAVNDYLRHPSKWSHIEKNLRRIDDEAGENCEGVITTTISLLNVYYLPELIKWKMTAGLKKINALDGPEPIINTHPLHSRAILSMKVLPPDAKIVVAKRLMELKDWLIDYARTLPPEIGFNVRKMATKLVQTTTNFMMSEDHSHLLPAFWAESSRMDEIRGEKMSESLPELFELIKHTQP